MTDPVIALRGKLPKGAAIHRSAARLYTAGRGTGGYAVIRWHVDQVADADDGEGVRIAVDQIEVAGADFETPAKQLLADLIEARGGNQTLPFDEADHDRYKRFLAEWAEEEGHADADVQRLWNQHFNPSEDPELVVPGPTGATAERLYEFLGYVGAIDETVPEPAGDDTAGEPDSSDDEQTTAGENGDDEDSTG